MKNTQKKQQTAVTSPAIVDGANKMASASTSAQDEMPQVVFIPVVDIIDSPFNPRQHFGHEELEELAESIKSMGLITPILVRPKDGKFERIYGERRYRASVMAGLTEIPAYIRELPDKQAEELALAENLFRVDLSPLELAEVLDKYTKNGYTIKQLVETFGFREYKVRLSIKLNELIPEMKELLKINAISLGIAHDLSQYPEHIQKDVFVSHFSDECSGTSWRQITVDKFRKIMKDKYTRDLKMYAFDKTKCSTCAMNTRCSSLFPEEGEFGSCTKPDCLKKMNNDYLTKLVTENLFCTKPAVLSYDEVADSELITSLENMGYDIKPISWYSEEIFFAPETPSDAPVKEDYEDESDYLEAVAKHEMDVAENAKVMDCFNADIDSGKITTVFVIRAFDILTAYMLTPETPSETSEDPSEITESLPEDGMEKTPTVKELNEPLLKDLSTRLKNLQEKFKRNGELAQNKKVEKASEYIAKKAIRKSELHPKEESMFFSFFMGSIRQANYTLFGLKKTDYYFSEEHREKVLSNLTPKRKAIIMRDYLISKLTTCSSYYGDMLLDFVQLHFPEDLSTIEEGVDQFYSKRNENLQIEMEKIEKEISLLEKENEIFEKERELLAAAQKNENSNIEPSEKSEVLLLEENTRSSITQVPEKEANIGNSGQKQPRTQKGKKSKQTETAA